MSINLREAVRRVALKAFMRYRGFFNPVSSLGARLKQRQQVQRMLQGFIAKTGKDMPIKDPVERNRDMRNLMILGCSDFFSQFMKSRPPYYSSNRQSPRLQQSSYYTTAGLGGYSRNIDFVFSYFCPYCFSAYSRSCLSLCVLMAAALTQSILLGFCIFCSGTSLQSLKNAHKRYASITCLSLSPRISYYLSPVATINICWSLLISQRDMEGRGRGLALVSRVRMRDMLSASRERVDGYQTPRYFDFIQHCITDYRRAMGQQPRGKKR